MPFYEKCQNCRDSIIQTYCTKCYSNRSDVTDGPAYCRRWCTRWKKWVEDYNTCEDWMPKNNV